MADMKLLHLVESGIAVNGIAARLDANAVLGWKIIQVVFDGSAYTLIWQKTAWV